MEMVRGVSVKDSPFTVQRALKSLNSRVTQQMLELNLLSPNEIISETKKLKNENNKS